MSSLSLADVVLRKGDGLRRAALGLNRLVARDREREAHCSAASFLVGYLVGIPTFCFQINTAEALNLLQEHPDSLQICTNQIRQPCESRLP